MADPTDCAWHDVGNGCHAYVQRDGGWGWSNAGLVVGDGVSLLVDTLFDNRLTAAMLQAAAPVTAGAPLATLVNTHANGDHHFGNAVAAPVGGPVEVVASAACAAEMTELGPDLLASLNADPTEVGELFRSFFGEFHFDEVELRLPDRTFSDRLRVDVGGRTVELVELGPAHTQGDVVVHVPDASTVFTGDLLFHGGTPIVWAGPLSNWVAACDAIVAMAPETVVPGHGQLATLDAVRSAREYLVWVEASATEAHAAGVDPWDAAQQLARELGTTPGRFDQWGEFGRLAVNVEAVYRELDPAAQGSDVVTLFQHMAAIEGTLPG
jgi:glyoxylase-like metal-dependent hydrolase (beta-lactamase superfamily II)